MNKICSRCGIEKDVNEFEKDKRAKNGVGSCCKKCHSERSTQWNKDNPDKKNKYNKQ